MPKREYSKCNRCKKPIEGRDAIIEIVDCMPTTNDSEGNFKQRKKKMVKKQEIENFTCQKKLERWSA